MVTTTTTSSKQPVIPNDPLLPTSYKPVLIDLIRRSPEELVVVTNGNNITVPAERAG